MHAMFTQFNASASLDRTKQQFTLPGNSSGSAKKEHKGE